MKNYRKTTVLIAMCATIAALVVPAIASAASLQRQDGTLVPLGTAIKLKSSNFVLFNGFAGWIYCEASEFRQEVVQNDGETLKTVGTAGSTAGPCSAEGVETASFYNIQSRVSLVGSEPGTMHLSFAVQIPGGAVCPYKSSPVEANYESGSSLIDISGLVMSSGCGEGWVEGTFALSDGSGNPLFVV